MRGLLVCLTVTVVYSSSLPAQPKDMLPSQSISLEDLVMVQAVDVDGKPHVLMTVDTYQTERTTLLEPESRIRLDTADGKTLLLKYSGPRTEVLKDVVTSIIPRGRQQIPVPAADVRFFRLTGRPVARTDALRRLAKPRPIVLLDDSDAAGPPPLSEVLQLAFDPDCLIAITTRKVREVQAAAPGPVDGNDEQPTEP